MDQKYLARVAAVEPISAPDSPLFEDEHADQAGQWATALLGVDGEDADWFDDMDALDAWLGGMLETRTPRQLSAALSKAGWSAAVQRRLVEAPHPLPLARLQDMDAGATAAWFILSALARLGRRAPIPTVRVSIDLVTVREGAAPLYPELDRWLRLSLLGVRLLVEAEAGGVATSPLALAMAQGGDPVERVLGAQASSPVAWNLIWGAYVAALEPMKLRDSAWAAENAAQWWMQEPAVQALLRSRSARAARHDPKGWWIARVVLLLHPALLIQPREEPFAPRILGIP